MKACAAILLVAALVTTGCVFELHRKTTYMIPVPIESTEAKAASTSMMADAAEFLRLIVQTDEPLKIAVEQNGKWCPVIYVTETVWFALGSSKRYVPKIGKEGTE